ncbi:MAG TPA: alpha/beta hydrolase [Pyrinomonadaceae bacterium]|nr:alpha/beta hydrolase [Pyrinomonadaceae bacterium]
MKERTGRRACIVRGSIKLCAGFALALVFSVNAFSQANRHQSLTANVNGVKIHYLKAGTGKTPLVLLHGFGETSRMWIPMFDAFGKDFTIIAPDLRGLGDSSRPASGYDKKTAAADVRELVKSLGRGRIDLAGHDIGLMVAYAYAAQYPDTVEKLALLEAPIPGVGDVWEKIYNDGRLWHFHFVDSQFALSLVKGRERIFLDHFWEEMTTNPKAMPEADRRFYTESYARDGAMRAAFEYFKAFDKQDAEDNRKFAARKLPMPVLVVAGDKSMGDLLEVQAKMVADNVTAIRLNDTGHWVVEERPAETEAALKKFFRD